jgi:lipoate---protein ligase
MNHNPAEPAWRLITDDSVTASFGLAADDYLAGCVGIGESSPTLRLYTYRSSCALVGRFQNIENELHLDYCSENNIPVNRRPTGGGAIIMGEEQLGIALTLPGRGDDTYNRARELMGQFSEGILQGLLRLGVEARFRRKNDIEVDGRKIVGLGIFRAPSGGLLFHASLLVDLNIPFMLQVLNTPLEKLSDKSVNTVAARITTVRREMGTSISLDDVRKEIARGYATAFEATLVPGNFTSAEHEGIGALEQEKYLSTDWIHQTTAVPDTSGSARIKTPAGLLDVRATLAGGTIKTIMIGGDFFASENAVADLEASLRWHTSHPEKVTATLSEAITRQHEQLNDIPSETIIEAVQKAITRARLLETQTRSDPYGCFVNPGGGKEA